MSEDYVLQITYQGVDSKGRTVMLNIRGATFEQFDANLKSAQPLIAPLLPLPQKSFGGAGSGKKPIVYLPTAPKCPNHQRPMNIREWTSPEGNTLYFWSCGERDASGYCKSKVEPRPTPEQIAEWRKLNGIETPNGKASTPPDTLDQLTSATGRDAITNSDPAICKLHDNFRMAQHATTGAYYHQLPDGSYCNGTVIKPPKKVAA